MACNTINNFVVSILGVRDRVVSIADFERLAPPVGGSTLVFARSGRSGINYAAVQLKTQQNKVVYYVTINNKRIDK